jgi:hypothetical protein
VTRYNVFFKKRTFNARIRMHFAFNNMAGWTNNGQCR